MVLSSSFGAGARDEPRSAGARSTAHLSPGTETNAAAAAFTHRAETLEERGAEFDLPDSVLAREMKLGQSVRGARRVCHPGLKRMRQRRRSPAARKLYERRKGLIEPGFGTLREHPGVCRFYPRGLAGLNGEKD